MGMTGFNLYRLYRRAGNAPRNSLRMAIALLWRDFLSSQAMPSPTPPADPHRRARLDRRAHVERRARQRL
jgi:hypothetical protein